jgi:serine/threonine protein kinase
LGDGARGRPKFVPGIPLFPAPAGFADRRILCEKNVGARLVEVYNAGAYPSGSARHRFVDACEKVKEQGVLKRLFQRIGGKQTVELPGFALLGTVREGSMSTILKARKQATGRIVAIKVHKPQARKAMEKLEAQYRDFTEGQITASFDHPNVIKCFDHGEGGGTHYLVLEYLEGMTLASLMAGDSKRLEGRRLAYVRQAAAALAHIHSRRFIHHDCCMKNLFVTNDDQVKLIDFGLATPLLDRAALATRMGTVEVLAPEVLRREPSDYRVDIFAWGVVAYQVLSGHWPFESPEHHQTLSKILNVHPVPLERRTPGIPVDVANLVMRCLEKEPLKRLSTETTIVSILERHREVAI